MLDETWTPHEKKIARRAFEAALGRELAAVMVKFKARAARAKEPDDMWATEAFLNRARREIDDKYDYRYSQLDFVFARLLREKWLEETDLDGLSEGKRARIVGIASL